MSDEVHSIAAVSGWIGPLAAVWFNRSTIGRLHSTEGPPSGDQGSAAHEPLIVPPSLEPSRNGYDRTRFDDTIAIPFDAPQRLAAIICDVERALRRMPPGHLLSPRALAHRVKLQGVGLDAARAHARLGAGTYGACADCSGPIALARLQEKPWTQQCIYCALDL